LYKNLLHKSEFGQSHCEEWFKRIHTKFICNFWTFLQVSTNFESLPYFLEFKIIEKQNKIRRTVLGRIRPEAKGLLGAASCCGSGPSQPHGPRAWPSRQPTRPARARRGARARPVVTARWPRARCRAGAAGSIRPGDEVRGIWRRQLTREEGEVPGKAKPAGTHRGGGTTTGWRGQLGTTTFRWRAAPTVGNGLAGGGGPATRGGGEGGCWWRVGGLEEGGPGSHRRGQPGRAHVHTAAGGAVSLTGEARMAAGERGGERRGARVGRP
jgi:hypothetical protein